MNPSVSVVIPSYNHAAYVEEAIRSVLAQSHRELEIAIADDGSRDGTPEVIRRIADPRIDLKELRQNRGAAAALNDAIRRSRGGLVCMLASDDVFLPGRLQRQVRFLRDNLDVAAVFGMPRFIDQRGAPLADSFNGDVFEAPFRKKLRSRADWLRHFFYAGNGLCHPASMVRRAVYDKVGLFDPRLASLPDLDMWVRICMEHDIRVLPDEAVAMRILHNSRNMSAPRRDSSLRTLIEHFHILKHYRGLSRDAIREVFAPEIAATKLDTGGPTGQLLAELALLGDHPFHRLFALDTMFEGMPEAGDHARLIELAGAVDVFAIETVRAEPLLLEQVGEARAQAAQLRAEVASLEAAQAEAARVQEEAARVQAEAARVEEALTHAHREAAVVAAARQRLADRLHAALNATYVVSGDVPGCGGRGARRDVCRRLRALRAARLARWTQAEAGRVRRAGGRGSPAAPPCRRPSQSPFSRQTRRSPA